MSRRFTRKRYDDDYQLEEYLKNLKNNAYRFERDCYIHPLAPRLSHTEIMTAKEQQCRPGPASVSYRSIPDNTPEPILSRQVLPGFLERGHRQENRDAVYPYEDPSKTLSENRPLNSRLAAKDNHIATWRDPIKSGFIDLS